MSHPSLSSTHLGAPSGDDTTVLIIPPSGDDSCLNVTRTNAMCFGTAPPEGVTTPTTTAAAADCQDNYYQSDHTSSDAGDSSGCCGAHPGGCRAFWAKWKYVFIIIALSFFNGISNILVSPILPGLKRRYFGSDKDAAFYQTTMNAVSCSIGLVLCPLSGYAMDVFGRRPFFLLAASVNIVPPVLLLVFYPNPLPFMIAQAVAGLIIASFASSYIADHYESEKSRVMAFSFAMGGANLSLPFAFLVFGLSDHVLVILSGVFKVGALLFTFFCIEESLPHLVQQQQQKKEEEQGLLAAKPTSGATVPVATAHSSFDWSLIENPFKAMKSVMNSKIAVATVAVQGMCTVSQVGMGEVYFYYLNEKVGFGKSDNAIVMVEAGLLYPLVLLGLVPFLKKVLKLHSITIVMIAVVALAAEMTFMCVVSAKWQVFTFALPLASLVSMAYPALITLIADGSSGEDQGRRQAGLQALADFFGTLAPLFFGQLYSNLPSFWGFIPFAIAACLCIPTLFLTVKLRHWVVILGQRNLSANNSAAPTPQVSVNNRVRRHELPGGDDDDSSSSSASACSADVPRPGCTLC